MIKVRIDGYQHYTDKKTGEAKTIVYYSSESKNTNCYGFVHAQPAWIDGVYDYKVNDFYELVCDTDLSYGKPFTRVIGFDVIS